MIYKNARIITKDIDIKGYLTLDDKGNIIAINEGNTNEPGIDCQGLIIIPSLIDTHTHGGYGMSFDHFSHSSDYQTQYQNYLNGLIQEGVVAFVPTNVSLSLERLNHLTEEIKLFLTQPQDKTKPLMCAWFFEGPFIAKSKKGAHDENALIPLDPNFLDKVINDIKLPIVVAIAPEEHNNLSLMEQYKDKVIFALGHSNADYYTATQCFNNGAKRVIHLYNAMSGFNHRDMGIVNAVLDKKYTNDTVVELISDGVHVTDEVVHMTYNVVGGNNLGIVSDCLDAKGLSDGEYLLGTLPIEKRDNWCYLKNTDTLAGSCCGYNFLIKHFKKASQCSWQDLVKVSSYNNARNLGLENNYGDLALNMPANFIVVDEEINVYKHIINGQLVFEK